MKDHSRPQSLVLISRTGAIPCYGIPDMIGASYPETPRASLSKASERLGTEYTEYLAQGVTMVVRRGR
jgi:hypothetical protein